MRPLLLLTLTWAAAAFADEPLPMPERIRVCSPNKRFCAVADPKTNKTTVLSAGSPRALWSIAGWHRSFFVSDDGDHLVLGPEGLNLLDADVKPSTPLLTFFQHGVQQKVISVGDLFPDLNRLEKTVSHRAWGGVVGIDDKNHFAVKLVDGTVVTFDVATGERLGR